MKLKLSMTAAALLCALNIGPAKAETFTEALTGGDAKVDIRYRFENVDQDNLAKDANASTVRTRLGYLTGDFKGFNAYIELDDVRKIGVADYHTPGAGPVATLAGPKRSDRPVVADPIENELNRLYVEYKNDHTAVKVGRQRIIRNNARFVGNVGWRQHEQTFDAISIVNKVIEDLTLSAAYIDNRNTITFTDIEQDTILLDASYKGISNGNLSAYYYDIKVDDAVPEWENFGISYEGKANNFLYKLEYAKQENANGAKPDYSLLEAGYNFKHFKIFAGIETLGSDQDSGFATPLATLHKFNGWADQFLATPSVGLEDKYLKVVTKQKGIKFVAVIHQFDADEGSLDFGDEINLLAVKKFSDKYSLGVKYANYSAGDADTQKVDTQKLWLWGEAKF